MLPHSSMLPKHHTLIVAAFCLAGHASSLSLIAINLLRRDDLTCALSNTTACGNGLPGNFCCSEDAACIVLASNTTGLCCPKGRDCSSLSPILCDIQQQNVTAVPGTSLMTTNLTSLQTCGTGCCPFGYSCVNDNCQMNANQDSAAPISITASPTTTIALPTATSSLSPVVTLPLTPSSTTAVGTPLQSSNPFPVQAVLVGLFPGIILGIALTIILILILGARRASKDAESPSSPFGRVHASISDPIYSGHNSTILRSYSLRPSNKSTSSPASKAMEVSSTGNPAIERVRSMFRKSTSANGIQLKDSPSPRFTTRTSIIPPVPRMSSKFTTNHDEMRDIPLTPQLQRQRSSESINVFADPETVPREGPKGLAGLGLGNGGGLGVMWDEKRQTSFTELMEHADLGSVRRGEGYVQTPPRLGNAAVGLVHGRAGEDHLI